MQTHYAARIMQGRCSTHIAQEAYGLQVYAGKIAPTGRICAKKIPPMGVRRRKKIPPMGHSFSIQINTNCIELCTFYSTTDTKEELFCTKHLLLDEEYLFLKTTPHHSSRYYFLG